MPPAKRFHLFKAFKIMFRLKVQTIETCGEHDSIDFMLRRCLNNGADVIYITISMQ